MLLSWPESLKWIAILLKFFVGEKWWICLQNQKNLFPDEVFPDKIFYSCRVFLNPRKLGPCLDLRKLFPSTNRKDSCYSVYFLSYVRETKSFDFSRNNNGVELVILIRLFNNKNLQWHVTTQWLCSFLNSCF